MSGGVLGVKTPRKLFAIFLVSQLCLFVQQNIFRLWNGKKNTKQKSMQACTKTHHFEIKNAKIFWGGDTLPGFHLPRHLDLCAYGAQAQRDTPEKNPSLMTN